MAIDENLTPGQGGHTAHHVALAQKANELDALTTTGRLGEDQLSATYAGMPSTYLDPRDFEDGAVTGMSRGTFGASFGNTPAAIVGGKIVHTPSLGASTACYIEADTGGSISRIGALIECDTDTDGDMALVIPSATWSGGIGTAGLHLVVQGNGAVDIGYFDATVQDQKRGNVGPLAGGVHRVEAVLDHNSETATVYINGELVIAWQSATGFSMLSNLAIWELYEATGVSETPMKFLALWADGAAPARVPRDITPGPYALRPVALAVTAITSQVITTTATTLFSSAFQTSVIVPPSGKLLATLAVSVDVAAGDAVYAAPLNGNATVLFRNATGAAIRTGAVAISIITGTPGTIATVDWRIYKTGTGSSTALAGSTNAAATAVYEPLAG